MPANSALSSMYCTMRLYEIRKIEYTTGTCRWLSRVENTSSSLTTSLLGLR